MATSRYQPKHLTPIEGACAKVRPGLKLCGDPSEAVVLKQVLAALRYHPKVAWAYRMNTGKGFLSRGRVKPNEARWITFGFQGCSDILGQLKDGRLLAIEVKKAGGMVKPHQVQFLHTVADNKGIAFVTHSVDETLRLLG